MTWCVRPALVALLDQRGGRRRRHGDLPQYVAAGQFPARGQGSAISRFRCAVPVPAQGPGNGNRDRHLQRHGGGADGIEHDFKTRQFTPLGNYREFLTRQIVVEGAAKVAAGQKHKLAATKGVPGAETSKSENEDDASEDLARTAIKLIVRLVHFEVNGEHRQSLAAIAR